MDFVGFFTRLGLGFVGATVVMTILFINAHKRKRYDVVDVGWGLAFIAVAILSLIIVPQADSNVLILRLLFALMVVIWGLRLSMHILKRHLKSKQEDKRYVEIRKNWKTDHMLLRIYTSLFFFQAVLASLIMIPVVMLMSHDKAPTNWLLILGLIIWIIGFGIEIIADRQLRSFVSNSDNKGKIMNKGLWAYSRHPNYFGEVTLWWGFGIVALGLPYGFIGLIGPLVITCLILFVSGIPPTEKAFAGRPGWNEYVRITSVLIPWFKRK
ncbi:MAG: DUF1295 domain-containing protein [bacterium]|nr:DUF1295 domain-containing protein [bacterium]